MPIHDWTRVEAGIFHHFHHAWIEEISRTLNAGLLPGDYYAMAEQHAAGFGPDVLTLQGRANGDADARDESPSSNGGGTELLLAPPKVRFIAEAEADFYHRKQTTVVVRHVSGDEVIAMIEVVSPGNKSTRKALEAFIDKAAQLMARDIHLLVLDLHPPSPRDPRGIHAAIWEDLCGQEFEPPADKPLTLASYEFGITTRAYVEPVAVGDSLIDMPLFLRRGAHVAIPLETTYQSAFDAVPRRWRTVLQPATA